MERFETEKQIPAAAEKLSRIFSSNTDRRICVVGASCTGKTTLLRYLPQAVDMDDLLFGNPQKGIEPLLTEADIAYVSKPWTPVIGDYMTQHARELITIEPGRPVFGTVVFPSDIVVHLTVPDEVLTKRIHERDSNAHEVFAMSKHIATEIEKSGIEKIVVENV